LYLIVGISAGLSIPFIFIAFNPGLFVDWMNYVNMRIRKNPSATMMFAILVSLCVLFSTVWTSSLTQGVKVAITIATVLGSVVYLLTVGLYRLVRMAKSSD
jgi:hypothetical protein